MPPVHLAPGSQLRQQPTPAAPRLAVRPQIAQTTAYEFVDDPFPQMEQDLAIPLPPVDRVSQTPARPETRPASQNRQARPSQSVLGQQQNQLRTPALGVSFGENRSSVWQDQEPVNPQTTDGQERQSARKDCGYYRELLLDNPISTVALDISPPRDPQDTSPIEAYRDWTDVFGQPICSGTLVELQRGYAVIDTGNGLQKVSIARLSENDLAVLSGAWELPSTCIVSADAFTGRCWMPQTMTWHASNLCHKPLYFEDVQLERYGHSDGPFMQPVRSTAHFLVSLATFPYQTGIHPQNECQYALGYYRPGNCAPWLGYPVPISTRGALHQAAFMLTGAYTIF